METQQSMLREVWSKDKENIVAAYKALVLDKGCQRNANDYINEIFLKYKLKRIITVTAWRAFKQDKIELAAGTTYKYEGCTFSGYTMVNTIRRVFSEQGKEITQKYQDLLKQMNMSKADEVILEFVNSLAKDDEKQVNIQNLRKYRYEILRIVSKSKQNTQVRRKYRKIKTYSFRRKINHTKQINAIIIAHKKAEWNFLYCTIGETNYIIVKDIKGIKFGIIEGKLKSIL